MADLTEFTPDQLDGIEDALEGLEASTNLSELGLDDASTARLGDFQQILAMSREVFELEAPGPALLDDVIAQARRSVVPGALSADDEVAAVTATPSQVNENSGGAGWRRWLPWLALAGSTAGVLMFLRPQGDPAPTALADAAIAKSEADDSQSTGQAGSEAKARARSEGPGEVAAVQDTPLKTSAAEEAAEQAMDEGEEGPAESQGDPALSFPPSIASPGAPSPVKKKRRPSADKTNAAPTEPTPSVAPDKEAAWASIEKAHSLRRRGRCQSARALYRGLLDPSLPATLRAKAEAGIGLCRELEGESGMAESNFTRARAALRGIDGWISAERDEMRAVGKRPKKKQSRAPAYSDPEL